MSSCSTQGMVTAVAVALALVMAMAKAMVKQAPAKVAVVATVKAM